MTELLVQTFELLSISVGLAVIGALFLESENVVPKFRRPMELMSFTALAFLNAVAALTLDRLFALGEITEVFAAASLLLGVAILAYTVRSV